LPQRISRKGRGLSGSGENPYSPESSLPGYQFIKIHKEALPWE
jgi:hypothetical protein